MIQVVRSHERYHFENEWLSTYWHFSFDHYYDPENLSFGPLRVFNDDTVGPGGGFPMHSHREMEIITIPFSGRLEHRDSVGNHGTVGPNEVQRMSAGTGISHSEFNASREEPVHLAQIWILPAVRGLKPSWEQKSFAPESRKGVLLPVASGDEALLKKNNAAVRVHQDTTLYLGTARPKDRLVHELGAGRRAYLFIPRGSVSLNGNTLQDGDLAKVSGEERMKFEADKDSEILLIDLP